MRVLDRCENREAVGYRAVGMCAGGAVFTAVCAQVAVYLPGNPVPITLQVFAALLCGMALGSRLGASAQIAYLASGAMGLPVFAGFKGGWPVLAGPTGGYLVGMVCAAAAVGYILDRMERPTYVSRVLAGLTGVAVIYIFGRAWLAVWLGDLSGLGSWVLGVAPFVGVDCVKVLAAAAICSRK